MKLVRLHQKYLFNKRNLIIMAIIIVIIIAAFTVIIIPINRHQYTKAFANDNYFYNSILVIKMLIPLFACFIMAMGFTKNDDSYRVLCINNTNSRTKYLITKVISTLIPVTIVGIIAFFIYITLGFILTNWFFFSFLQWLVWLRIMLMSYLYGAIAILTILIFQNPFALIIPCISYIMSEMLVTISLDASKLIAFIFPNLLEFNNTFIFRYTSMQVVIMMLIYLTIGVIVYQRIDI